MDPEAEGLSFIDWGLVNDEGERQELLSILYPTPADTGAAETGLPEPVLHGTGMPLSAPPHELAAPPGVCAAPEQAGMSAAPGPVSWADEMDAVDEEAASGAVASGDWEPPQHQEFGGEQMPSGNMSAGGAVALPPPRGAPVAMFQPMGPPPGAVLSAGGPLPPVPGSLPPPGPLPPTGAPPLPQVGPPPLNQSGANMNMYPMIMNAQSAPMILSNVNVSLNANVQGYVPMANYQHNQYEQQYENKEKDRRRSGTKMNKTKPQRDYNKQQDEQSQNMGNAQYPQQFIYHQHPATFNYMPHHTTAQQVAGPPLFISAHAQLPVHYQHAPSHQHGPVYYTHHFPYIPVPMMPTEHAPVEGMQQQMMMEQPQMVPPQHQDFSVPPPMSPQQPMAVEHQPHPPQQMQPEELSMQHSHVEKCVVPQAEVVETKIEITPEEQIPPQQEPMPPAAPSFAMESLQAALPECLPEVEVLQEVIPPVVPAPVVEQETPPALPPPSPPSPPQPVLPAEPEPVVEVKSPEPPKAAPRPVKSWASIVQASSPPIPCAAQPEPASKPLARVNPYSSSQPGSGHSAHRSPPQDTVNPLAKNKSQMSEQEHLMDDPMLYRLGEYLCKYAIDHRSSALQPRGLTNRGNWCYVNATLQALVACPPFYNLMRTLPIKTPMQLPKSHRQQQGKSPTPIVDAVVEFMQEFSVLPHGSRPARKEKAAVRKGEEGAVVDVPQGTPFEPSCVYAMLSSIRSATFKVEGRQEDAEEFLSCLLNALNDEMLELMKLVEDPRDSGLVNGQAEAAVTNGDTIHLHSEDEDGEQWTVMRGKNRACLTRRSDFGRTPVSDIFRGQLCSHVQRKGEQQSENVQPFYTLQLDIEKARSVREALEQMVDRDWLEGVTCSRTQQQVEAWQQVTLEELPPVLLLHLKWFDYKPDGCTKIMKNMEYSVDLKIENKLLSKSTSKYTPKQRVYKLFAVVYHDGKEASKGHYITDAYHSALGVWVRYDDNQVRVVTEQMVTHPRAPAVPYILYYRRSDTMGLPLVKSDH